MPRAAITLEHYGGFYSLYFFVFSKLSPVSMYHLYDLHRNNKCCLKSILRSRCDLKAGFVHPGQLPGQLIQDRFLGGLIRTQLNLNFTVSVSLGPRGRGHQESATLHQPPRGQGPQQYKKGSFVVLSENGS